jgi:hypothetical protein
MAAIFIVLFFNPHRVYMAALKQLKRDSGDSRQGGGMKNPDENDRSPESKPNQLSRQGKQGQGKNPCP